MPDDAIQVPAGLTVDGLLVRRYFARAIDSILITPMVAAVFALEAVLITGTADGPGRILLNIALFLALWIGYGTALESSAWQATVGKRLMRLKAYGSQAGRLTGRQAAGRNLLVLHRSPVYQAIHDRAAGSWVAAPEETIQLRLA